MFDKIKIVISSFHRFLIYNQREKHRYYSLNNSLLIVFSGLLGDAVMFLDTLNDYIKFAEKRKLKLILAAKQVAIDFYETVGINTISYYSIDMKRYCVDYEYYLHINNKFFEDYFYQVVVPHAAITADVMCMNVFSGNKESIQDNFMKSGFILFRIFRKVAYDKKILVNNFCQIMDQYRTCANKICDLEKKTTISNINDYKSSKLSIPIKRYIIVCPFGSNGSRNWEIEKFERVIEYLKIHEYDIAITGTKIEDVNKYKNIFKNDSQIHIYYDIALEDLIKLIQHAKLLIGVDSAPIHIAAALGIQSICILGGRDRGKVHPYNVSCKKLVAVPICVAGEDMRCFGCNVIAGKEGYRNKKCKHEIKKGNPALCVQNISASSVIDRLEKILNNI